MNKLDHPRVWAWTVEGGLCHWAHPNRAVLMGTQKPSPEAKPVCVRLVPNVEYRKLLKGKIRK